MTNKKPEKRIAKEGAPIRDLVNLLFEVFVKPDGKPYTSVDVAQAVKINPGSLANLRSKHHKNVTLGMLQALATFFDVSLDYFASQTVEDATLYLAKMKAGEPVHIATGEKADELVAQIMAKTMTLSVDARHDLLNMMRWLEYGDKHRPRAVRDTGKRAETV